VRVAPEVPVGLMNHVCNKTPEDGILVLKHVGVGT